MEDTQINKEKFEKFKDLVKDLDFSNLNPGVIKDNKAIYIFEKDTYRAIMPKPRYESEAKRAENSLKMQLLSDSNFYSEEGLIKLLKNRKHDCIDIEKLREEKIEKEQNMKDIWYDLALTDDVKEIERLREKLNEVKKEYLLLSFKISSYLEPSIESQCDKIYIEHLTYLCTEKLVDKNEDKWEKVWNTFDEFENDETGLAEESVKVFTNLLMEVRNR